jgi:tartrate dehydratase alpha subunit/fumarate hydratase class I-like protein
LQPKAVDLRIKPNSQHVMPSDSLADWIVDVVPSMGAGWCPPGMLGIGVGGTAEKAMIMAKESLMEINRYAGS